MNHPAEAASTGQCGPGQTAGVATGANTPPRPEASPSPASAARVPVHSGPTTIHDGEQQGARHAWHSVYRLAQWPCAWLSSEITARVLACEGIAALLSSGRFTVTPTTVVETFGDGPVPTTCASSTNGASARFLDAGGWLWWNMVGAATPTIDTSLVDGFQELLGRRGSMPLLLVVGPSGSGKTFAAMQLACREYVDFVDAGKPTGIGHHLFLELEKHIGRGVVPNHVFDLLLRQGESGNSASPALLNSRWAHYHVWVMMHALSALRSLCDSPRDWLFFQRHHGPAVVQAFRCALNYATDARLSYAALESTIPNSSPYALVLDEAAGALRYGSSWRCVARPSSIFLICLATVAQWGRTVRRAKARPSTRARRRQRAPSRF